MVPFRGVGGRVDRMARPEAHRALPRARSAAANGWLYSRFSAFQRASQSRGSWRRERISRADTRRRQPVTMQIWHLWPMVPRESNLRHRTRGLWGPEPGFPPVGILVCLSRLVAAGVVLVTVARAGMRKEVASGNTSTRCHSGCVAVEVCNVFLEVPSVRHMERA